MIEKQNESYDWGLRPLHDKMLELLTWLHSFCRENGIDYCLAYGSALGAVRHKGFIPWDDDVDIYMTGESYKKFRALFRTLEGESFNYLLQEIEEIDGMCTLSKIRIKNTTFIEPLFEKSNLHQGVYIDIFILHNAPSNSIKRHKMCISNQYLILKSLSNRHFKGNRMISLLLWFLRLFPRDFMRKTALKQVFKYDEIPSKDFFDVDLRTYSRSFYEKAIVFPAIEMQFEDTMLMVPSQTSRYLSFVYGDYMKIPDLETIKKTQHAALWDVNVNYTEYISKG